jgi:hypothetical protein
VKVGVTAVSIGAARFGEQAERTNNKMNVINFGKRDMAVLRGWG